MKKSTKVALSLLVPAMTAFGCSDQSQTAQMPANAASSYVHASQTIQMKCSCGYSFTVSGDSKGKTVQCPECNQTLSVYADRTQATPYSRHTRTNLFDWFGGRSSRSSYSPPIASANRTTKTSHAPSAAPPIASANHTTHTSRAPSASHVSSGGFGGTGAHFSGGS